MFFVLHGVFAYNLQPPEDQSLDSPAQDADMGTADLPSDVEEAEPTCLNELSPFFQDFIFPHMCVGRNRDCPSVSVCVFVWVGKPVVLLMMEFMLSRHFLMMEFRTQT